MHVLFPADSFRPRLPDEAYADEFAAAQAAGFNASVFSFEAFQAGTFAHRGTILPEQPVLYRGWMLSLAEYTASRAQRRPRDVVQQDRDVVGCPHGQA